MEINRFVLVQDNASGAYLWKLEEDIQNSETKLKPWEVAPADQGDGLPTEIVRDLEGFLRREFAVPPEVTAENNYAYRELLNHTAMNYFHTFGEAFQNAVEDAITEEVGHWTGIC